MRRPSRDPGPEIKRILRNEVNFGCPVRFDDGTGCGSPVLTYHHFDPPWAGNFVHNPDGMIALCPLHHNHADGEMWSNEQLRQMKKHPYVDDVVRIQWPWQPETLVMKVGRSLVVGSGSPIRLHSRPAMMFRPAMIEALSARTVSFDSEIRDREMRPWLRIQDGWFDLRLLGTTDVIFTPQNRSFLAQHNDETHVKLTFLKKPVEKFLAWASEFISNPSISESLPATIQKIGAIDHDGNVPIMVFEGRFRTKEVGLEIRGDRMTYQNFLPGVKPDSEEKFQVPSYIVSGEYRVRIRRGKGPEFLSIG